MAITKFSSLNSSKMLMEKITKSRLINLLQKTH